MRYIFTALMFVFMFLMAVALSGHVQEKVELIPKPTFDSVLFSDGRTVCEKKSEMNLIRDWENKCFSIGADRNCSLPKKDVTPLFENKRAYVSNCR